MTRAARVAAPLAALMVAACGTATTPPHNVSARYYGALIANAPPKPTSLLETTSGTPYDIATATARTVTLLYFGYTHCPDICPLHMATIEGALRQLPPADRAKVTVLFVTTDPQRDTPTVLRSWLDRFDRSFIGLTGTPAAIGNAQTAVGIPVAAVDTASPASTQNYAVDHSGVVLVYSQDNKAHDSFPAGVSADNEAHDVQQLVEHGWQ